MSYDRDQITDLVHQSQLETIDKCSVCLLTIHEWKKKRREKVSWFLVVTRRDEQSSFPNWYLQLKEQYKNRMNNEYGEKSFQKYK